MLVSLWCTLGLGPLGAKELLKVRVRSRLGSSTFKYLIAFNL